MIWRFRTRGEVVYLRANSEGQARERFAQARPGLEPEVVDRYHATVRPVTLHDVLAVEREREASVA